MSLSLQPIAFIERLVFHVVAKTTFTISQTVFPVTCIAAACRRVHVRSVAVAVSTDNLCKYVCMCVYYSCSMHMGSCMCIEEMGTECTVKHTMILKKQKVEEVAIVKQINK